MDTLTTTASANNTATSAGTFIGATAVDVVVAQFSATTDHTVEAYLGPPLAKNPPAEASTNLVIRSGALLLDAESQNTAKVLQVGIDVAAVAINVMTVNANAAVRRSLISAGTSRSAPPPSLPRRTRRRPRRAKPSPSK